MGSMGSSFFVVRPLANIHRGVFSYQKLQNRIEVRQQLENETVMSVALNVFEEFSLSTFSLYTIIFMKQVTYSFQFHLLSVLCKSLQLVNVVVLLVYMMGNRSIDCFID